MVVMGVVVGGAVVRHVGVGGVAVVGVGAYVLFVIFFHLY